MKIEQTLFIIKPDALKYSVTGYILTIMSRTHLVYAGSKVVRVDDMLAGEHYSEHRDKDFFPDLVRYIKGELHYHGIPKHEFSCTEEYRRVFAIVYHGPNAVQEVRDAVGPTSPIDARLESPGTIRAMGAIYNIEKGPTRTLFENLVHASATPEEARVEIELWFEPREIPEPLRIFPVAESEQYFFVSKDMEVTTEPGGNGRCIASPGDPGWEDDYKTLTDAASGKLDKNSLRRAVAKYML